MAGPSRDLSRYFYEGADIEISSEDEGFWGSWFAGKVIRPPKDCSAKVLVQYRTLMEDDASNRPLREELRLVQLRPMPPPENRRSFKCNEDVDAYYHGGWWEGIITEELGDDRYLVFFRGSREQLAFNSSKLRLHHEWVYGKWVPPLEPAPDDIPVVEKVSVSAEEVSNEDKVSVSAEEVSNEDKVSLSAEEGSNKDQVYISAEEGSNEETIPNFLPEEYAKVDVKNDMIECSYGPGELVEVSSDEEGFEGAWFPATIVKELGDDKYLIEHQNLKDDDGVSLLREEIDILHIRPCPPDVGLVDRFEVLEKVDALYNDGWWCGVVSKVLKNDRYTVYFSPTEEELKFEHTDLRVHQDWINGKWVIASKVSHL